MVEALWLVRNGVPYDVAFSMPEVDRAAHAIIFSQFEGNVWDWERMKFEERS